LSGEEEGGGRRRRSGSSGGGNDKERGRRRRGGGRVVGEECDGFDYLETLKNTNTKRKRERETFLSMKPILHTHDVDALLFVPLTSTLFFWAFHTHVN